MSKFAEFLEYVRTNKFNTSVTARGVQTIQQTVRNKLRLQGQQALCEDLQAMYPDFDIMMVKDGIAVVANNHDFDFTMLFKATIPSIEFDPYFEADDYEAQEKFKAEVKKEKEEAKRAKAARDAKLREEYKQRKNISGDDEIR